MAAPRWNPRLVGSIRPSAVRTLTVGGLLPEKSASVRQFGWKQIRKRAALGESRATRKQGGGRRNRWLSRTALR